MQQPAPDRQQQQPGDVGAGAVPRPDQRRERDAEQHGEQERTHADGNPTTVERAGPGVDQRAPSDEACAGDE